MFTPGKETPLWDEVRIHMHSSSSTLLDKNTRHAVPKITFPDKLDKALSLTGKWRLKNAKPIPHFCDLLATSRPNKPRVNVTLGPDNELWQHLPTPNRLKQVNPVSLAAILGRDDTHDINQMARLMLAVILGYSLFYLYEGPWLGTRRVAGLSREKILFFQTEGKVTLRPFLHSDLGGNASDSSRECSEDDHGSSPSHPYPNLVEFGVTLLEIHLGTTLESYLRLTEALTDVDDKWVCACQVFSERQSFIPGQNYRDAIKACLDTQFGAGEEDDDEAEKNVEQLRDLVFSKIVGPLQDELEYGFGTFIKFEDIDEQAAKMDFISGLPVAEAVAVVDSPMVYPIIHHIHPYHNTHYTHQHNGQIAKVCNWVDGQNGKEDWDAGDTSGHGTHVASIILRMVPNVDLYVARVTKGRELSGSEAENIAKAIETARASWCCDIINLSLGFTRGIPSIDDAIKSATNANILIFAAASNDGANSTHAYPAWHSRVLCIHSTDGYGNRSRFNPSPDDHGEGGGCLDGFSIVGEHVSGAWPSNLSPENDNACRRRISGTSFAAPVAAALAACVLEFAAVSELPSTTDAEPEKPQIYRTTKYNVSYTTSAAYSGSVSVFASFAAPFLGIGPDASTTLSRDHALTLRFSRVDTQEWYPSTAELRALVGHRSIARFLACLRLWNTKDLYVVTGVKVAYGARAESKSGRETKGELEVSLDPGLAGGVPGVVEFGPGIGLGKKKSTEVGWETGTEGTEDPGFVFAYKVRRVKVKKKNGEVSDVTSKEYTRGALYQDVVPTGDKPEEEYEICTTDVEDEMEEEGVLVESGDGDDDMRLILQ
ncbi:hypothetical protein PG984_008248 [Apiospora sp. TS-2023a]